MIKKTTKTSTQLSAQKMATQNEKRSAMPDSSDNKERWGLSNVQRESLNLQKGVDIPVLSSSLSKEQVSQLLDFVMQKLDAGKAENIVSIDLEGKTSFADYLVIATGTSTRHIMGLMTNLLMDAKKAGYRTQISGDSGASGWIVIDMIDIVVHLFTPESRDFYSLEDIWNKKID